MTSEVAIKENPGWFDVTGGEKLSGNGGVSRREDCIQILQWNHDIRSRAFTKMVRGKWVKNVGVSLFSVG
jgi:hypothetical protein